MWQKTARLAGHMSSMTRYMVLIGLFLPCFIAACNNSVHPSTVPPQPGKVLYILRWRWDKPVHSLKDLATTSATLIAEAVHSGNGQKIWQVSVGTGSVASSFQNATIISAGSTIFVIVSMSQEGEKKGQVMALDAQSGQALWKTTLDGASIWQPVVANGNLYMEVDDRIEALDGKQLWTWQTSFILSPFAPPNHIYGSSLNKNESFCALHASDGSKAWCSSYDQAGPALFSQGKIYLYASQITYRGSSSSEQPAQVYVLNEKDGSLAAHYSPDDGTRMRLVSMALS